MPILTTLTGGAASYFWQGTEANLPTGFTNTAPDTVILAHATDTMRWFVWDGIDWQQVQGEPDLRLADNAGVFELQYSLNGVDYTTVSGWDTNFPLAVQHYAPKIQMVPGLSYPPIPSMASGGADYVYSPPYN